MTVHSKRSNGLILDEINEEIVTIMIFENYLLSILGLNSGFTVKYNPSPFEVPSGKGLYLTLYHLFYGYRILNSYQINPS